MLDFLKGILKSQPKTDSTSGKLNKTDIQHVLYNGLLVGAAAGLTYLGSHVTSVDLGNYSDAVIPVITMIIVAATQWLKDNTKE